MKIAEKIIERKFVVNWLIGNRKKWAEIMSRLTSGFSTKVWKLSLVCLLTIMSAASIYITIRAFTPGAKNMDITHIAKPKDFERGNLGFKNVTVAPTEYKIIASLRKYLDTLSRSPTNIPKNDSILAHQFMLLDIESLNDNEKSKIDNYGKSSK